MHPEDTTYDELWQKSRDYAAAVKAVDPAAKVLGFSEWGWPNYFCSGADHVENGCSAGSPDRAAHGARRWSSGCCDACAPTTSSTGPASS